MTINSIWTWMIPICLGWVWVGSQTSHSGIRDALENASQKDTGQPVMGIRDATGDERRVLYLEDLELQHLRDGHPTAVARPFFSADDAGDANEPGPIHKYVRLSTLPPTVSRPLFSADVAGDAMEPGPIHNYARLWTHMAVAREVVNAFTYMNLRLEKTGAARVSVKGEPWNYQDHDANLVGDAQQMAAFIGLQCYGDDSHLYSAKPPPGTMTRMLLAAFVALFVQWGTTGSAIVIAY